jgi:hypothetical protein
VAGRIKSVKNGSGQVVQDRKWLRVNVDGASTEGRGVSRQAEELLASQ